MHQDRRKFISKIGLSLGAAWAVSSQVQARDSFHQIELDGSWIDMKKAGASFDGKLKNTALIQQIIEALSKGGGGTLYFPPGKYLTGAIHMLSNIRIYLEGGAELVFSEDFDDYLPMVPSRWQGLAVKNFSPLIYAQNATNISITGQGTINGSGQVWWDYILKKRATYKKTGSEPGSKWQDLYRQNNQEAESIQSFGFLRPSLFQAYHCQHVRLEGVFLRNSPFWTTHFVACQDVMVHGLDIRNPDSPNTDGINPESSRNVTISNCRIDVDDDCITIKSGKGNWGRKNAGPCENIAITNCLMTGGASGVGIGSEMSGGVRKVTISNCIFDGTSTGLHIKTNRQRGGVVEDVQVSNLVMNNIHKSPAIHINTKYWIKSEPAPVNEKTPRFKNIHISNITGNKVKTAVEIIGLEEMPVQDISINHLRLLNAQNGLICSNATGLSLNDIDIRGTASLPYQIEDSDKLIINNLNSDYNKEAPLKLVNVKEAVVAQSFPFNQGVKVSLEGTQTRQIQLDPFLIKNEQNNIKYMNGASSDALVKI
ncbi:MAG: glycoside hydrolase family 28 protein [Candidatus Cyclobacteriaceae bacterium M3_2C_046]